MMATLSQAQFPTAQSNRQHIETVFSEIFILFVILNKITASYRYSSSIFKDGKRRVANCTGFGNILIYDIDNDTKNILSLEKAIKNFEDISSLIVTTKSHQKVKNEIVADRFRVLIPLDEAISIDVNEYSDYYLHIASILGIEKYIDHSCKDAARMYQPNQNQEVYYSNSEVVLSEKQLRISFEEKKFLDNSSREILVPGAISEYGGSKTEYLRSILQTQSLLDLLKYDEKFVTGNRNNFLYSVGRYLIDNQLSENEVRNTLVWMNSLKLSLNQVELNSTVMRSLKI